LGVYVVHLGCFYRVEEKSNIGMDASTLIWTYNKYTMRHVTHLFLSHQFLGDWAWHTWHILELSIKYVQKRKLRANFIKTGISTSQGAKCSLVVVFKQSKLWHDRSMANAMFAQVSLGSLKVLLCNQLLSQTSHLLFYTSSLRQKTL
jgi:hypothetical protein